MLNTKRLRQIVIFGTICVSYRGDVFDKTEKIFSKVNIQ